jgi:signal transduction histidine kinase
MEEELRKRSEELQEQNERVLAAIDERNHFYRSVSHELRTPLTSIIGFAELLLEDSDEPLTQRQELKLKRVISNSHKLLGMVNDLLDLSRVEAGRMDVRWDTIKLDEFLRQIVNNLSPLAVGKMLKLNVDVPPDMPPLTTDEQKLGQIVVNLVSNAIKFTPEGRVDVSARLIGNAMQVDVRDTGTGIAADEIGHVFKEFYRGRKQGPGEYGSGLGLAIAKRLTSVLGGTLTVESELEKGSVFTLTLPVAPCAEVGAPGAASLSRE